MNNRLITRVFAWCILAIATTSGIRAQFESGTVLGTIRDASGAMIANASVTLVNDRTGISARSKTDANGSYEFVNQRTGAYRVRAEMQGFQTAEVAPFDLVVNARQRVDLWLKVGQASESVTVTGAAELMETDTSSRGQVINPREIVELPLNGRLRGSDAARSGSSEVAARKRFRQQPRRFV
jgi:hypothetical protein